MRRNCVSEGGIRCASSLTDDEGFAFCIEDLERAGFGIIGGVQENQRRSISAAINKLREETGGVLGGDKSAIGVVVIRKSLR